VKKKAEKKKLKELKWGYKIMKEEKEGAGNSVLIMIVGHL
jgi:hypothetical protein